MLSGTVPKAVVLRPQAEGEKEPTFKHNNALAMTEQCDVSPGSWDTKTEGPALVGLTTW